MEKQIKSRKRVVDHGEVFTSEREVNAMLDLVKQETERIDTDMLRFLYTYIRLEAALALPLGELSPQVTERVLQPVLNGNVNLFAHTTKIPVNIPVGKSQNLQAKS